MKRILSLLLTLALVLGSLSACGEERGVSTPAPSPSVSDAILSPTPANPDVPSPDPLDGPSALTLAEAAFSVSGCEAPEAVERINAGEDAGSLAFYVENAYGLAAEDWEDAAVIRAAGASAFEIAVLRFPDEDAALRAAQALAHYCVSREGDFTGYAPDQADMASKGIASQKGDYAALFICPEASMACAAFTAALESRELPLPDLTVPSETPEATSTQLPAETPESSESPAGVQYPGRVSFIPPNKDDMSIYDTSTIRYAWAAGDPSGLSDYDRAIYDAAQAILAQTLKEGMSDYQKEAAVYQWLVQNVNYDWTHNDVMVSTPRESFTPYGGLVNRTAVCLGYATSFQLLMDLAGVEFITVVGAAHQSTGDHAWNMVRLDGNWYCVDVTWDASRRQNGQTKGLPSGWRYFNVTSSYMAGSDHQWDYANIPEAVTEGNGK